MAEVFHRDIGADAPMIEHLRANLNDVFVLNVHGRPEAAVIGWPALISLCRLAVAVEEHRALVRRLGVGKDGPSDDFRRNADGSGGIGDR